MTLSKRVRNAVLSVGVISLVLSALGLLANPPQFYFSYLFAFVFWIGLPLGCLCVLMLHSLTGGGWGYVIRRFLEAGVSTLPWMAILFLPLLFGLRYLYPWMDPAQVAGDPALQKIRGYLNLPFFLLRNFAFFGVWIGAGWYLNRLSSRQDRTPDVEPTRRARAFSGPGLLVFTLMVSLALVDWIMVSERDWYSTVFPAQVIIGQLLFTFAFCTLVLAWSVGPAPFDRREGSLEGVIRIEHFHSLGNFLLAFVMLWAYLTISQLIIIWSGNVPREITWYLHRVAGGWRWLAITIGALYFALPFCLLLSRENKRNVRFLRVLVSGIIVMHALEVWWQIAPSFHRNGMVVSWLDCTIFVGIGGVWIAAFLTRLLANRSLPQHDPRMAAALAHGH